MGKFEVYEALKALGGSATSPQLRKYLTEHYPDQKFKDYYHVGLKRLVNDGTVSLNRNTLVYTIVEDFQRNVITEKGQQ